MNNFKTTTTHALSVAGHIFFAAIVVGLGVLINNNPTVTQQFSSFLLQFGIPTAVVNIIVAAVVKFIETKAAETNVTPASPTTPTV